MNSFDYEGENDPDFDESKADRNKDGKISDWERSVGNAVAKSMREQKENKSAEEFEAEIEVYVLRFCDPMRYGKPIELPFLTNDEALRYVDIHIRPYNRDRPNNQIVYSITQETQELGAEGFEAMEDVIDRYDIDMYSLMTLMAFQDPTDLSVVKQAIDEMGCDRDTVRWAINWWKKAWGGVPEETLNYLELNYDDYNAEEFGAEEGAFYQLEVKYNMEDGWEHIGDFSHKEEAIKTYQELKNKHPEVRFLEVLGTDDDGYEWREYDDESNDFKNAESFDAEFSKGDMLNLKKYIDYPMRWIDKNIRPSSDAKARKLEQKSKGQIPTKKTPDSFRQKIETPNWFKAVQVGILASVIGVMYFKDSGASEEPEEPEEQKEE